MRADPGRSRRRWFWQDEYGSLAPGWAITLVAVVLVVIGLGSYWFNDMHMYHYGPFGSQ